MNQRLRAFIGTIAVVLLFGGCCDNCDKPFLGEFNLTVGEEDWIGFAQEFKRQFRSSQGQEMTFFYSDFTTGHEDLIDNCEDTVLGSFHSRSSPSSSPSTKVESSSSSSPPAKVAWCFRMLAIVK